MKKIRGPGKSERYYAIYVIIYGAIYRVDKKFLFFSTIMSQKLSHTIFFFFSHIRKNIQLRFYIIFPMLLKIKNTADTSALRAFVSAFFITQKKKTLPIRKSQHILYRKCFSYVGFLYQSVKTQFNAILIIFV